MSFHTGIAPKNKKIVAVFSDLERCTFQFEGKRFSQAGCIHEISVLAEHLSSRLVRNLAFYRKGLRETKSRQINNLKHVLLSMLQSPSQTNSKTRNTFNIEHLLEVDSCLFGGQAMTLGEEPVGEVLQSSGWVRLPEILTKLAKSRF